MSLMSLCLSCVCYSIESMQVDVDIVSCKDAKLSRCAFFAFPMCRTTLHNKLIGYISIALRICTRYARCISNPQSIGNDEMFCVTMSCCMRCFTCLLCLAAAYEHSLNNA